MPEAIGVFNEMMDAYYYARERKGSVDRARQKSQDELEIVKLKKQEAQAQLKRERLSGKITENDYKINESQMNEYFKQQEIINKGNVAQIDMEEDKITNVARKSQEIAAGIIRSNPQVAEYAGQILEPVRSGSGYSFKRKEPEKIKDSDRYQIMEMARKMADDEASNSLFDDKTPYAERVKKYIPQAEEMLTGTSSQPNNPKPQKQTSQKPVGGISSKYKIGQIINKYGKQAKVVDIDKDGTPIIELVK